MMELTVALAPYLYSAAAAEREREASASHWLRLFRSLQREARERERTGERTVIVSQPAHLAGVQKIQAR
ncbi:MAG TPA: hypothetical protein VFC53_08660 [Dehalococcoidia bacterium]|jgi:hypothetical protein|nr:hypothetical protein [Dehalococcoidia bacterium]